MWCPNKPIQNLKKMKHILAIFSLLLLFNCGEKKEKVTFLPSSSGDLNSIAVVTDNVLWENEAGESIREILAAPAKGLPTDEPMFSLRQIPTSAFKDDALKNRTVIKVEIADETGMEILNNVHAKPQLVIVVKGKTELEISNVLKQNSAKIIDAFTKQEVSEKLRLINKSLLNDEAMETGLGFTVDIPSIYRIAKSDDNFYWVRKGLSNSKTLDLMFYSYPLDAIRKGDSTVVDIIKMRDKMIAENIPGEDGMTMITQKTYAPSIFEAIIDNKPAFETRGMWKIADDTAIMGGPFINYAIEDKVNNRYLVAEGYVYAPSLDKREYIFELEAIIKSIEIK